MASPMPTQTVPTSQLRREGEEPHAMSAEELRAHLFRSLQEKGILSQLKSQLRCRLVQELKHGVGSGATPPLPLDLQVANSIVAEHMRVCGYEYSLSTFLPESHTSLDKLLSRGDVLRYLQLQPSSPLHTALSNDSGRGVQTEEEGPREPLSLAARLQVLDQHHAAQLGEEGRGGGDGVGEMVEGWKRECEEQMRRQMDREVEEFRERELSQAREDEKMRCEAELCNLRIEQEDKHQKKMESIRRLELDTIDRMRRKELETEAALHTKRQELQQLLQAVKGREDQLHRDVEMNRRAVGLAEQKIAVAAEQVAAREREVVQYGRKQEAALQGRERRYHQECELQLESKRAELVRWEAQLQAEQGQQAAMQAELQQTREQVREARERKDEVQSSLHEATRRLVELQRQKEDAREALKKMSDHGQLKQQLSELRIHVAKTERKLSENRAEHRRMQAEQQEVIRGLRKQLGRPNADQLRILEEAERVKRECQLKLTEAEEEKRMLRREVSAQTGVCAQLRGQLEEQTLALREMEREVTDLTAQLGHFQTALLHSRHRRYRSTSPNKPGHLKTSFHPSPLPSPPPHPLTHSPPHPPLSTHESDPSSLMLLETKATFVRLEQEAAELEKHYKQFHQRIAAGPHPPAPAPSSPPLSPTPHLTSSLLPPAITSSSTVSVLAPVSSVAVTQHTSLHHTVLPAHPTPPTALYSATTYTTPQPITSSLDHTSHPPTSITLHSTSDSLPPTSLMSNALAVSLPATTTLCSTHTIPPVSVVRAPPLPAVLAPSVTHLTSATRTTPSVTGASYQTSSPPVSRVPLVSPVSMTESTRPLSSAPHLHTHSVSAPHSSSHHTDTVPHTSAALQPTSPVPLAHPTSSQPSQPPRMSLDQLWKQPQSASETARAMAVGSDSREDDFSSKPQGPTAGTTTTCRSSSEVSVSINEPPAVAVLSQSPHTPSEDEEGQRSGSLHLAELKSTASTASDCTANHTASPSAAASGGGARQAEEGVDPLMLKYMELVKQRRAEEKEREGVREKGSLQSLQANDHSQSERSHDFGLPPLSQPTESFGAFSEQEQGDDPFQDW